MSKEYIEQIASELIVKYSSLSNESGYLDVFELVKTLGGSIEVKCMKNAPDISLTIFDEGEFNIAVPTNTSSIRDRFQLAHELGHYFLHYNPIERVKRFQLYISPVDRPNVEDIEANRFAAHLLIPTRQFAPILAEGLGQEEMNSNKFHQAARQFGVSRSAVKYRTTSIGR